MKEKLYIEEQVNYETGKVLNKKTGYQIMIKTGRYFMGSFTDWYKELTGSEIKTLISLLSIENSQTGKINLNNETKIKLCKNCGICMNQFEKNIRGLIAKDKIKRLNKGVYVINPDTLWMGDYKSKLKKQEIYANHNS